MIWSVALGFCVALIGSSTSMAGPSTPVGPENGATNLTTCRALKDAANRLKCYDKLPLLSILPGGSSAPIQAANDEKVVMKWSGSATMQTRPFHVDGPWELQWSTDKGYFSATLHRTSGPGSKVELLANGMGGGSSSSYRPTGGDFYLEFGAMQRWSARVVSVPAPDSIKTDPESEEPLLNVSGDQSGLPPCNGAGASDEIKNLIEHSPLGQTMHISVIHVGAITSRQIKDGMSICSAPLMTNGGEISYDFQFYRKDGRIFIYGKPHLE